MQFTHVSETPYICNFKSQDSKALLSYSYNVEIEMKILRPKLFQHCNKVI